MSDTKERHTCMSCLHYKVCEWAVNRASTICDEYIDKKDYKRPVGEWVEHTCEDMSKMGFVRCSICKAGFRRYERGIRKSDIPYIDGIPYELHLIDNYCPNCGAYMRGNKHD